MNSERIGSDLEEDSHESWEFVKGLPHVLGGRERTPTEDTDLSQVGRFEPCVVAQRVSQVLRTSTVPYLCVCCTPPQICASRSAFFSLSQSTKSASCMQPSFNQPCLIRLFDI
jgi:hypothetical protein